MSRPRPPGRGRLRPRLEQFEDRTLLSNFTAASVSDLINDINAANAAGGANTITLATRTTFTLTQVNNTSDGPTGLPVVAAGDNLTIVGNNQTIERSITSGTPDFRLLDVASGASLTLENMTLQDGELFAAGAAGSGGAIYCNGDLALSDVTVTGNSAVAGTGVYIAGGTANLSNDAFTNNSSVGSLAGGAVCIVGGTANLDDDTFDINLFGGTSDAAAIYVGGGTVTLSGDLVQRSANFEAAIYISGGVVTFCHDTVKDNYEGIDIVGGSVGIDQFTVAHTTKNFAFDIQGSYTLIPNC
jgi:hypothetical protein